MVEHGHPNGFLKEVAVVNTPGINAVLRHHEELSRDFVPRSDLVLFITSADRPFSESERDYLQLIHEWGKKVVLVVNKTALLEFGEVEKVRDFVEEQASALLDLTPPVFMASARVAQRAKNAGTQLERYSLMQRSGFNELDRYVLDLLKDEERVRLKLESPLGIASRLT